MAYFCLKTDVVLPYLFHKKKQKQQCMPICHGTVMRQTAEDVRMGTKQDCCIQNVTTEIAMHAK